MQSMHRSHGLGFGLGLGIEIEEGFALGGWGLGRMSFGVGFLSVI